MRRSAVAEKTPEPRGLSAVGTGKIAGMVCNKKAPVVQLNIELEVPIEELPTALETLGLEATPELVRSMEAATAALRRK